MQSSEKLCLQWNDFQETVVTSFQDLNDFHDVTLASSDNKSFEVHRVILASCSPVFTNILKQSKGPHPFIYLRGIDGANLESIIEFLYKGKVNVYQEDLESFLRIAEELQMKGLTETASTHDELLNQVKDGLKF